ncbi:ATP-binding cassette domain-containing protein [Erythrobacter sp.]|uniref:ABC transporter ATP-binding protein n=1 Tax=Sphingomonadales TaxID=204457 RepID=UPI003263A2C9
MQLAIRGVGLSYGDRRVLSDIWFSLDPRERVLLLGPSGSGKSSLLNIICGLQTPDEGSVSVDGVSIGNNGDTVRKQHMGIIFQTLRLVSALTVRANLFLAQRLQTGSTDAAYVDATLDRLGIADRANARPCELSQGEAQRAAIARAVVVKPQILIADEPTSALDHANTESVAQLLIEAADEADATLLIATHDDRLKAHFARTLSLQEGRIES